MDIKSLNKIQDTITKGQDSAYVPTEAQKKAKSKFWAAMSVDGAPPLSHMPDLAQATRFGSIERKWWDEEGFRAWFWNRNEFSEKLEYLGLLALEELESTLKSKLITSSQKIPAIKLALEVTGKLGKPKDTNDFPDKIAAMNAEELQAFIAQRKNLLTSNEEDDTVPKLQ